MFDGTGPMIVVMIDQGHEACCTAPPVRERDGKKSQEVMELGQGLPSDAKKRGHWEHIGKLARDPQDGPRGPGAIRLKNALPTDLLFEYLNHCLSIRDNELQTIVVDLCSGWQSYRPVCEALGLSYIAVDIMGDRNRFLPKPLS